MCTTETLLSKRKDMYQILIEDKYDSLSRLTLLLRLSPTFHATMKLLDSQLLQADAHGQDCRISDAEISATPQHSRYYSGFIYQIKCCLLKNSTFNCTHF